MPTVISVAVGIALSVKDTQLSSVSSINMGRPRLSSVFSIVKVQRNLDIEAPNGKGYDFLLVKR